MQIIYLENNLKLWNELIDYANKCEWEAWPILAQKMQWNSFSERERVFVATEDENIAWYCTFTKEDWIPNCDYTPFVWFIFVDEKYRWKRYSEKMINTVEKYARTLKFHELYIISDHKWLYEKYWFEPIDIKTDELWRSETIFKRKIKH